MCLTLSKKFRSKKAAELAFSNPLIATEDIVVFKKLSKRKRKAGIVFSAPYQNFLYEKGTHYYQEGYDFTSRITKSGRSYELQIYEGLHAKTTAAATRFTNGNITIEMIVPKGSKYFLGINNDIVSNNLIWR